MCGVVGLIYKASSLLRHKSANIELGLKPVVTTMGRGGRNEIFPSSGRADVVDEEGMRKEEVVE